jgi:NAD(P)-dependent dehydrogenase (short-subunit alcohol dehydrogenase family)
MTTIARTNVLITGATSGIGLAATQLFAREGYRVFATYRSDADELALGRIANVRPVRMDVTRRDSIEHAFGEVSAECGDDGLYALVNNAGIGYAAPFEYASEERGREVMDVNLMAPFNVSQVFLPLLTRHNATHAVKARIVNVASWAGVMGQPFIPFYNASKFGLIGLTESMFYDLGLLDIHVVLASPGVTKTPLLQKTTNAGTSSLETMPPAGRAFYRPLLDHYATLGAEYGSSTLFLEPGQVAAKLLRIVGMARPSFRQNLSADAWLVDRVLTRWVPWCLRVKMNRRMFLLDRATPAPRRVA